MFFFLYFHSKIVELEEELRVVGNNLKSLEVSEEKVRVFVQFESDSRSITEIASNVNCFLNEILFQQQMN